jgi:hypothetical protein
MVVQLPNVLIFGAQKCGTTALYHSLQQHPPLFLPKRKEPCYTLREVFACLGVSEDEEFGDLAVRKEKLLRRSGMIDKVGKRFVARYSGTLAMLVSTATKWSYVRRTLPKSVAAKYYRHFEDDLGETSSVGRVLTTWQA